MPVVFFSVRAIIAANFAKLPELLGPNYSRGARLMNRPTSAAAVPAGAGIQPQHVGK
jgi:hypothetical protein